MRSQQSSNSPVGVEQMLRAQQIIVFGLLLGLVVFTGVTAYLLLSGRSAPSASASDSALLLAQGGLAITTIPVSFILKPVHLARTRRDASSTDDPDGLALFGRFAMLTLQRAALAEGMALFGVITTLITGDWWGLGGMAAGLLMLFVVFPSRAKWDGFVQDVTGRMPKLRAAHSFRAGWPAA